MGRGWPKRLREATASIHSKTSSQASLPRRRLHLQSSQNQQVENCNRDEGGLTDGGSNSQRQETTRRKPSLTSVLSSAQQVGHDQAKYLIGRTLAGRPKAARQDRSRHQISQLPSGWGTRASQGENSSERRASQVTKVSLKGRLTRGHHRQNWRLQRMGIGPGACLRGSRSETKRKTGPRVRK